MDALKKCMIIQFTVHTIPNHQPTFVKIILAAKWLVQHFRPPTIQQRRPLPSLLSLSFFYELSCWVQIIDKNFTIDRAAYIIQHMQYNLQGVSPCVWQSHMCVIVLQQPTHLASTDIDCRYIRMCNKKYPPRYT